MQTQVAGTDRRRASVATLDLATVSREHVITVYTASGSAYRVMLRQGARVGSDRISGVTLVTDSRRANDQTNTNIDRVIHLGRAFHWGARLGSHTSEVASVFVGGVRKLG